MKIERGVDRFANMVIEKIDWAHADNNRPADLNTEEVFDYLLFALDDLQRQIDELKEERR